MATLFAKTKLPLRRKNYNIFLEIITCVPSVYKMDHPNFIVCSFMENSIGLKRVNILSLLTQDELTKILKDEYSRI